MGGWAGRGKRGDRAVGGRRVMRRKTKTKNALTLCSVPLPLPASTPAAPCPASTTAPSPLPGAPSPCRLAGTRRARSCTRRRSRCARNRREKKRERGEGSRQERGPPPPRRAALGVSRRGARLGRPSRSGLAHPPFAIGQAAYHGLGGADGQANRCPLRGRGPTCGRRQRFFVFAPLFRRVEKGRAPLF